jgi:uncharacterized protein YjbI with pentapeptide repeats
MSEDKKQHVARDTVVIAAIIAAVSGIIIAIINGIFGSANTKGSSSPIPPPSVSILSSSAAVSPSSWPTEQLNQAFKDLQSTDLNIRSAAVYALGQLMGPSPTDKHNYIVDILATFVRDKAPLETTPDGHTKCAGSVPSSDVQKALTALGERTSTGETRTLDLHRACLSGADLHGANLGGVNLSGARLVFTDFRNATLTRANLECTDLETARVQGADLDGADLRGANLHNVNLQSARSDHVITSGVPSC